MSLDDGLVMQIHPGSRRNHSPDVVSRHGRDMGFDIPGRTDYVDALRPLLDTVGMEPGLTIILFTLDETGYSRELAPLAGAYPSLNLGPPWWFFDSSRHPPVPRNGDRDMRFLQYRGLQHDTRAFCSIPARHDRAPVDCGPGNCRNRPSSRGRAFEVAQDPSYGLARPPTAM